MCLEISVFFRVLQVFCVCRQPSHGFPCGFKLARHAISSAQHGFPCEFKLVRHAISSAQHGFPCGFKLVRHTISSAQVCQAFTYVQLSKTHTSKWGCASSSGYILCKLCGFKSFFVLLVAISAFLYVYMTDF